MTLSRRGLVAALFVLGAVIRAWHFVGFNTPWHWDDAKLPLQALEALDGAFPMNHLDNGYLGAAPAYLLVPWLWLLGPSPLAADVLGYGVGLAILVSTYVLARRFFDPASAIWALAILAVPVAVVAQWSLTTNLNHPLILILGNLLLLGTAGLYRDGSLPGHSLLGLGVLAGVAWWTNPFTILYLAPFGLLALRTGLVVRPRFVLFGLGLAVGGFPAWLYEAGHFPTARFVLTQGLSSRPPPTLPERITNIVGQMLPETVGVQPGVGRSPLIVFVVLVLFTLGVVAAGRAAWRARGEMWWLLGRAPRPSQHAGAGLLLGGVVLANLGVMLVSKRDLAEYYVLPTCLVLACWIGEMLGWLWHRWRALAVVGLAVFLGFQLWTNWTRTLGKPGPLRWRWTLVEQQMRPVVRWMETRGLGDIYLADSRGFSSWELTYLTRRHRFASGLWREPDILNMNRVDAAPNAPIAAWSDETVEQLRDTLGGLDLEVRESDTGGVRVFEADRRHPSGFVPLSPGGWRVSANRRAWEAPNLIDRDASTGWSTGEDQAPGQWIQVDLGSEAEVARVDLLALDFTEVPAGFRVEVSHDGEHWDAVVSVPRYWGPLFLSESRPFLRVRRGRVQAIFRPVHTRHLRIVQTGSVPFRAWSARELFVYGPGPSPAPPTGESLVAALRQERVGFVYANHRLSALVGWHSRGMIGALESNMYLDPGSEERPSPEHLTRFRVHRGDAILVGSDGDLNGIRRMLAARSLTARETAVGPYPLLVLSPRPDPLRRLSSTGWRATATVAPELASLAIDGRLATAWIGTPPAGGDLTFTVDLGAVRSLRRVRLKPGTVVNVFDDVRLEGSLDGATWRMLGPVSWAGPAYWTGSELLRNGTQEWSVAIPPTPVRHLRLRVVGLRGDRWALNEIQCSE